MPITAFTGPPGAGKSHALMKDVVLPALLNGRRVLTNIDGVDANAVLAYCLERVDDAAALGELVLFHGDEALKPGFWPDEETGKAGAPTTVLGGDLVVFDEWALYFPRRGRWPDGCNVEAFLRWHRHLTHDDGTATDVAIGTQLATDVHQNVRGLISKSYKFRKLTALGADRQYTWLLFEGHLQPKGGHYRHGTGSYDPAIFPLYASSAAARTGKHVELRTNKKESIWSGATAWIAVGLPIVLVIGGGIGLWTVLGSDGPAEAAKVAQGAASPVSGAPAPQPTASAASPWRIVGHIEGDGGMRVIIADDKGGLRIMKPAGFDFEDERPVSGVVEGRSVIAEERLPVGSGNSSLLSAMRQ